MKSRLSPKCPPAHDSNGGHAGVVPARAAGIPTARLDSMRLWRRPSCSPAYPQASTLARRRPTHKPAQGCGDPSAPPRLHAALASRYMWWSREVVRRLPHHRPRCQQPPLLTSSSSRATSSPALASFHAPRERGEKERLGGCRWDRAGTRA